MSVLKEFCIDVLVNFNKVIHQMSFYLLQKFHRIKNPKQRKSINNINTHMCIYTLLRTHCYLHIHYNVYADKNAESLLSGNEALSFILDSNMTKATFELRGNVAIAKQ